MVASSSPISPKARGDVVVAIADSYRRWVGHDLLPAGTGSSSEAIEQALMTSSAVILCHDGTPDPRFIFANKAAASLWRMSVEDLVGMPSRLSAPPEVQAERAGALAQAAAHGVLFGYSGERIAADSTRFAIVDATLWTVELPGGGLGQAATFDTWRELPGPTPTDLVR